MSPPRLVSALLPAALVACSTQPRPSAFELKFAPMVDGRSVGCADDLTGFGPNGDIHLGINDLRFYVSDLRFKDARGKDVETELDTNAFQYASDGGSVSLVDLTAASEGSCASNALPDSEGTARVHAALTGQTFPSDVASVSFRIGVPQPLMKQTISQYTAEGAPSPLSELYWSWNGGYRHFVLNFVVTAPSGSGSGFVHVGSTGCGVSGSKALADRDTCDRVNTAAVTLSGLDLEKHTVGIDLRKLLAELDFMAPIYDPTTHEPVGEGPGVSCHSSAMQPDCGPVFSSLGLDVNTGVAQASGNQVFVLSP